MLVLDGEHPVTELAFTPDGTRLVVGREGEHPFNVYPEVWTLATGEHLRLVKPDGASELALQVHPAGRHAFFAYGCALWVVSLADGVGQELPGTGSAELVVVSPDGKWVVCANAMNGRRHFCGFRCDTGAEPVCSAGWLVDSHVRYERLGGFLGAGDRFVTVGSHQIVVRETATGEVRATAKHSAVEVTGLVTSTDGGTLAGRSSTQFYVWDTTTWQKRFQLSWVSRFEALSKYTFHPARPILATIRRGQTLVKFLDANTGKPIAKFQWKLGEMCSVAFSPDGTLAAAGAANGKIVVWDVD